MWAVWVLCAWSAAVILDVGVSFMQARCHYKARRNEVVQ
jgi:hypothetical protein